MGGVADVEPSRRIDLEPEDARSVHSVTGEKSKITHFFPKRMVWVA